MSSILEALNKIEEERSHPTVDSDPDAPFEAEAAVEQLLASPKRPRRSGRRINWKPFLYVGVGLTVVLVLVGISGGVAMLVVNGASAPSTNQQDATLAVPNTPVNAGPTETYKIAASSQNNGPAEPEKPAVEISAAVSPPNVESASKPNPPVEQPKTDIKPKHEPKPESKPKVKPDVPVAVQETSPTPAEPEKPMWVAEAVPDPESTTPLPTMDSMAHARELNNDAPQAEQSPAVPVQTPPISFSQGRAAEKRMPSVDNINALPRLSQADRTRLGLNDLRLNVLREASASQPEALAIINLKKVYVGEMIPGTSARLIAVQSRAIAIEIEGTGEKFKVVN